ncbi:hypothetical protein pv_294 [Pithovirus sibericum]|uniref:Uncharacterized protein n=1 Tax=Pithovirus sibericum TaxID=1450746 RepID=W5S561_9VIRU|nr:hypothetical protein pv_294 [Pithovirus sibericum]AHH01861.1 hypothetical protein pv_294 [Pithovirus sibericum]
MFEFVKQMASCRFAGCNKAARFGYSPKSGIVYCLNHRFPLMMDIVQFHLDCLCLQWGRIPAPSSYKGNGPIRHFKSKVPVKCSKKGCVREAKFGRWKGNCVSRCSAHIRKNMLFFEQQPERKIQKKRRTSTRKLSNFGIEV